LVTEEALNALVGQTFPGGTFIPEPYFNWLLCDCLLAPEMINPDSGHPLMLYMATQAGMGISLQDLFTMFLGKSEDGPMLGEWSMQAYGAVKLGVEYSVTGGIVEVQRKTGKKTGVFDIIKFELQMRETADPDELVGVTRSSFIFPRRG
jgi:hypothetical protein